MSERVTKVVWIACDRCPATYESNGTSINPLRRAAKADGWRTAVRSETFGIQDFCPECSK